MAHPEEPGHFEVPPHLSGGAIDIGLIYQGKILNMGAPFDDLTEKASTDFFEKDFDPTVASMRSLGFILEKIAAYFFTH